MNPTNRPEDAENIPQKATQDPKNNEVKRDIVKEILKYLAVGLLTLIGAGLVILWGSIQNYAGTSTLNFLSNILTTEPTYEDSDRKIERPAYYRDAIIRFQESFTNFTQNLMIEDPDFIDRSKGVKRDEKLARSIRDFQQIILQKFSDLFTDSPDSLAVKYPAFRDASNQQIVRHFKDAVYRMVADNRGLIGYIQTGTIVLVPNSTSAVHQFQLFVDQKSTISLEFDVRGLEEDQDIIGLVLGAGTTCSLQEGWNVLKVDVVDLTARQVSLHGCSSGESQVALSTSTVPDGSAATPLGVHLRNLLAIQVKVSPQPSYRPVGSPRASRGPGRNVTLGYVALVSPLLKQ